jgi:hypothetical protein
MPKHVAKEMCIERIYFSKHESLVRYVGVHYWCLYTIIRFQYTSVPYVITDCFVSLSSIQLHLISIILCLKRTFLMSAT